MKLLVIRGNKGQKKIFKVILLTIGISVFWSLLTRALFYKPITLYGNKSFGGAQVYVNNLRAGTMVWDEKEKMEYAREERLLYFPLEILNQSDRILVQPINGEVEIKIITKENKTYKNTFSVFAAMHPL